MNEMCRIVPHYRCPKCGQDMLFFVTRRQTLIDYKGLITQNTRMLPDVKNYLEDIKAATGDKKAVYENNFDMDLLSNPDCETESGFAISQNTWDNIYKKKMDKVRDYIKNNQQELLDKINSKLIQDLWDKYCLGNISKWEMDSVSCYFHEHELSKVNLDEYNFADFYELPEEPIIERWIPIKNSMVPILKIERIIGTVLDRDKSKRLVTLLTPSGVVTVKIFGAVFSEYDKQISQKGADGKKHVIEKSLFTRGNKIIVTGIRREDAFIAKKYSKTPFHLVEQIVDILPNGEITVRHERAEVV